jgi:hypothetical protein
MTHGDMVWSNEHEMAHLKTMQQATACIRVEKKNENYNNHNNRKIKAVNNKKK